MKLNIRKTKVIALFLTLILLVTSMPISAYAENSTGILTSYSPADQATEGCGVEPKADVEATTVLAEIVSRREENVKHFDIGNGLYQAVTYGTAVHRKDSNGVWQDIDNRLVLNAQDNMYSTSDGRTRLSATTNSSGSLISLSEDGYTLSMSPISNTLNTTTMAEITNHEELDFSSVEGKSIEEASAVRNTSSVRYQNVFASADIEYILTSNDIKENIIVKSPQISYTYSFALSVQSLTAELQETGEIVFRDIHTNEIKYHIPAPYMYDSLGSVSHDVEYSLETVSNGYVITITADSSWLNNAERAFPVTIDPTIQKAIVFDTFISSANPTENYGSSSELWISPSRISFLRCSMPTIPSGCQFYAANLYVYYYYYSYITDGGLYAGAYQVMHSWSENELTWNIAQPSSTTYISSTRLSTGYMSGARGAYSGSPKTASFDVTTAAASWYANPSSNFGIALKYQSGTNSSVILKSYEAGSEYRAYFVITYTEPQIVNGVYRIKNAQNGMYLDTTGGGVTAGTKIQQWSRASSDTNRNQLFKITFVRTISSTEQLNYYTIRPMTNNRMGLDSLLGGTAQDVTIEKMSTSDNWDNILYNNLWVISKSGSYYTFKNGRVSDMSYMTAPSNTTNGAKIFTNDSITDYSKWVLEPYTGEELKGVGWISFASTLIVGEQFSYEAYMYDNRIGINGPISYSVTNTDNSTTDKATIDAMGRIRALKPGTIKIKITYPSSTLIWWWIVTIEESMEGLHFIKNRHYDRYAQVDDNDAPGYANNGGIMEIWPLSGENHQRWNLTHVGNGYYKIASQASGYVITVPAGKETNDNVDLVLKPYTGSNNQKWRITLTSHGSYKIKAKSSESYTAKDLVMDMETSIFYTDGLNVRQRDYVDNTSYRDEWFCIRMLPTNGDELVYSPSAWTGRPSSNNNCYAYALNNQVREPSGNIIWFKQQPGEYYNNHRGSCAPIPQGYQSPPSVIVNSVQQDFNKYNSVNGTSLSFTPIGRYETCPVGTYKVALVVSNSDYHWYRQDADGLWSHKRGTTPVKRTDESGELIIDPMIADRDDYSTFVGFFAVKPWNNIYNSSKGVTLVSEDVIFTTINDTQLSNIQIGMTYSEVTETLNSKGIDIGSGSIIQQYRSSGGVLYTFEYASTEVGFIVSKIIIGGEGK